VFACDAPCVLEHYTDSVMDVLSSTGRSVLVFEPPGCGFSCVDDLSFSHSFVEHANLWTEFLKSRPEKRFVSCIGCGNGFIALRCRSDLFCAYVTQQTPSLAEERKWMARVDFHGVMQTPLIGQIFNIAGRRFLAKQWFRTCMKRGDVQEEISRVAVESIDDGAAFPLATLFQSLAQATNGAPTSAPLLALWADEDRSHRRTNAESALQNANGPTKVLKHVEAGHIVELDNPKLYIQIVEEFLKKEGL
jgi:pimeloyl-ACP methyl ester carboxylesterase